MLEPIPTPTSPLPAHPKGCEDEEDLAAFQALFNRPPYDPAAALAKAQAIFPPGFNPDSHWLAWGLICANGLDWMLPYLDIRRRQMNVNAIAARYETLSSGEYILAALAMHLLNDVHPLPKDGLLNLRLLDDWHFELAMHAIRVHTRGVQ